MIYAVIVLTSFLLAVFLSPVTMRLNIFSKPKKGEAKGKPCLGGVAIFVAVVIVSASVYFLKGVCNGKLIGLLSASVLIILLGLIDDAKDLKPIIKIILESAAIIFLILSGFVTKISFLPVWCNILIAFAWLLFITNAFNLLDIADGLVSGLVIIVSATLLVIALINKDVFSGIALAALIGAHLGFLRYNYPPARLYMGDTGSLFSGFLLAAIAINISYAPLEKPIALITPFLVMSLPLYDTLFLIIMRLKKGKSIFSKTDDHFALRLAMMGHGARKSLWIMYGFSIFLAVSSLIVAFGPNPAAIIALIAVFLVFIVMGKKVGVVKIEDEK